MKNRHALLAALVATLGCEGEPEFSAEPGIEVCERIIDECGNRCDLDSDDPIDEGQVGCSFDSRTDYLECGARVVEDEDLQELHDYGQGTPANAIDAAEAVIVGFDASCESALSTLPVFCYGCRD